MANDLVALNASAAGVQVTGQATVSEAAPVADEDLTRKDYVDALDVGAGAGLTGGGGIGGSPQLDVGAGNGIDVLADSIQMSGDFAGQLDVTGDVTAGGQVLESVAGSDAGDAVLQGQLDDILGVSAQRRIQVDDVQTLGGTQVAAGQAITVNFAVAFDAAPTVTLTLLNPGNANNGFAYLNTVTATGFTATAGVAGLTCHWQAIGTNA